MEQNEKEEEVLNFETPSYSFKPNEAHNWRQQGPYLVCKGCELIHAVYIGTKKIMVGMDKDGRPIMKSRRFISG